MLPAFYLTPLYWQGRKLDIWRIPPADWATPPAADSSRPHVAGRWVRDQHGRILLLHGMNVSSSSKIPPFIPLMDPGHFDRLAAWGMNWIRLVLVWEAIEPERGHYDESYLELIDHLIREAWQRGIWTVIDLHQDLFSRSFLGNGAPAWACPPCRMKPLHTDRLWFLNLLDHPDVPLAFNRLWRNEDGLRDSFVTLWQHLAERFAQTPGVLAYDLFNEPWAGINRTLSGRLDREILPEFYTSLITAIRAVDPHHLIFVEPSPTCGYGLPSLMFERLQRQPNLVYSTHPYHTVAAVLGSYGGDLQEISDSVHASMNVAARLGAAPVIGEFGSPDGMSNGHILDTETLDLFDRYFLGWARWNYTPGPEHPFDAGYNVLDPNGREKPILDGLIRPYPQAIAGTPVELGYDALSQAFHFAFCPDPAAEAPTEIFVPAARQYAHGYKLHVEGGDSYTTEHGQRIHILADPGVERCVVRLALR